MQCRATRQSNASQRSARSSLAVQTWAGSWGGAAACVSEGQGGRWLAAGGSRARATRAPCGRLAPAPLPLLQQPFNRGKVGAARLACWGATLLQIRLIRQHL